jgi:hypothetical protein
MHQSTHGFGCLSAYGNFTATGANDGWNVFDLHGLPVNLADFAEDLVARLGCAAYVTTKHGYFLMEKSSVHYNSFSLISAIFMTVFNNPIFKSRFPCTGTDIRKSVPFLVYIR